MSDAPCWDDPVLGPPLHEFVRLCAKKASLSNWLEMMRWYQKDARGCPMTPAQQELLTLIHDWQVYLLCANWLEGFLDGLRQVAEIGQSTQRNGWYDWHESILTQAQIRGMWRKAGGFFREWDEANDGEVMGFPSANCVFYAAPVPGNTL